MDAVRKWKAAGVGKSLIRFWKKAGEVQTLVYEVSDKEHYEDYPGKTIGIYVDFTTPDGFPDCSAPTRQLQERPFPYRPRRKIHITGN